MVQRPWHHPVGQAGIRVYLREAAIFEESAAFSLERRMDQSPHDRRSASCEALAREIDDLGLTTSQRREILLGEVMMKIRVRDDSRRDGEGANRFCAMA